MLLNFHTNATEHDSKTKIRSWLRLASIKISNTKNCQSLKQNS